MKWWQDSGALLTVRDVLSAAEWLQTNLFFTQKNTAEDAYCVLQNKDCILYLQQGVSQKTAQQSGTYATGLAHIALSTYDIDDAIAWCQQRGLALELQDGESFFNPKVFGAGERFFNICSPFGVIFEVSQRVGFPVCERTVPICGLDHLGVPCADIAAEIAWFEQYGFQSVFGTITNYNDDEGTIYCAMLTAGGLTIELYQFANMTPVPPPKNGAVSGLRAGMKARSPSGLKLLV